ncbi:L-2-amino-thiazoline-4-carboxylic acid hydrolase [Arvimicrobium flavum]|uniref:L-2-amino-thiazoline-4-carboxylic acid hydrolase n=1 Tax=Arvimicrobium flavum TaxID=3393320 RepID=UPI00237B1415|nr:L-2-amino-thiazoline-4-carboxylic acid hydrolase [Mesorhizobium shangrilense]
MSSDTPEERSRILRREVREFASGAGFRSEVDSGAFDAAIDKMAVQFAEKHSGFGADQASAGIVEYVGEVLGSWLALKDKGLDDGAVRDALVGALSIWVRENAESYAEARLGIRRDQPDQAFENARANFKTRGEARFGSQFRYQVDVADDKRAHFGITRCLFNDLLRAAGYPQVIPVFCAMDIVWAQEVTHKRYNLDFTRPTTLAAGDDKCRFQFDRR